MSHTKLHSCCSTRLFCIVIKSSYSRASGEIGGTENLGLYHRRMMHFISQTVSVPYYRHTFVNLILISLRNNVSRTLHRYSSWHNIRLISPLKLDLAGKHILITGAVWSNGVGYATATAFARAGACAIALADTHEISEDLVRQLKQAAVDAGRHKPVVLRCTVDIASLESVRSMHKTVSQAFDGRLDILVNNAAHQEPYGPFLILTRQLIGKHGRLTSKDPSIWCAHFFPCSSLPVMGSAR